MTNAARTSAISELLVEALRAGNAIRIRVNGTSMLPAIWPGDVLTVVPATDAAPAPGDVALTAGHGRLLAHRVIERSERGGAVALVTRGDALASADPVAQAGEILGTVVARNGQPVGAAHAARTRLRDNFAGLVARSAPLLALTLKLRAITRRLVPAAQ